MDATYKNKNRGYQQLRVWGDAIEYYVLTWQVFRRFPYELKRVASQAVASADSAHRNIAEGYCRRSIREYLHFLNIALAYTLENGLLKLAESLERKQQTGGWIDSLIVQESNVAYSCADPFQHSTIP